MRTNIERLRTIGNDSARIFVDCVTRLSSQQGFYSTLLNHINNMGETAFMSLKATIEAEQFRDIVDVIMWLEDSDT